MLPKIKNNGAKLVSIFYFAFWALIFMASVGKSPSGFDVLSAPDAFIGLSVIGIAWVLGFLCGKEKE